MTQKNRHAELEETGLLGGSFSRETVNTWPAWARAHFARCHECRGLAFADEMIAMVAASRRPAPPMPAMEVLLARPRRPPPPLAHVLARVRRSGAAQYRDRVAQTLELACEGDGMRAFDPEARHLIVLAIGADGRARVLIERRSATPGQAAFVHWKEPEDNEVVAVSASAVFDAAMLLVWLGDHGASATARLVAEGPRLGLRVAVQAVPRRLRPHRLRVTTAHVPEATEGVRAILCEGVAASIADRQREAVGHYRRGLALAVERNDVSGKVKASVGIGILLDDLGYREDALRVLAQVAEFTELDAPHAAMVSLAMANRCRGAGRVQEAAAWLEEATGLCERDNPLLVLSQLATAMEGRDYKRVLALTAEPRLSELVPAQQTMRDALASVAAAILGDLPRSRAYLRDTAETGHREVDLWVALGHWMHASVRGPVADGAFLTSARLALAGRDDDVVTIWAALAVATAIPALVAAGAQEVAWALGRLVFLCGAESDDETVRFAGIIAGPTVSWVVGTQRGAVREVALGTTHLAALSVRLREECLTHDSAPLAHRAVLSLLGCTADEILLVGSTHGLHDLPVHFLGGGPAIRCVPPGVRHAAWGVGSLDIVSIADPFYDLPGARNEVPPEVCRRWLRGPAARRSVLRDMGPVGLLHVGVHGARRSGLPELLFADGPLTPADVEDLALTSHPVVVLSGCATAVRSDVGGVEQSFAAAFRRAGASAVVCTRVPVADLQMSKFTAGLIARWPFGDAVGAVRAVCSTLAEDVGNEQIASAIVLY